MTDHAHNALFDGDEILYKACRVCEVEVNVTHESTFHSDPAQVRRVIRQEVEALLEATDSEDPVFALSDLKANFRKAAYGKYKTNRVAARKPLGYYAAREWIECEYGTICWPSCEADDVMGARGQDFNIVISSDKDMLTVPGIYYSPYHRQYRSASSGQADFNFLQQTLTGDATDGYPGCPGVGPVKAAAILNSFAEIPFSLTTEEFAKAWHEGVVPAFDKAKIKRDPLVQARCARILRPGEASAMGVVLWEPPVATNDERT